MILVKEKIYINSTKKYFIIAFIALISNSLFASHPDAKPKVSAKAQAKSVAEILASTAQAMVTAVAGSSGAAASASAPQFEYRAETTIEKSMERIVKKTVIKRNSTGEELEERIEFSTTPYVKSPFDQIPSVKILGSRALYPALSLYKEALLLQHCTGFTKLAAANNTRIDISPFIHGPSTATFNLNNQTKNEQA